MSDIQDAVVEQLPIPEMPYYMTGEFHQKLLGVPFSQEVNGERIVNVSFKFFKLVEGVLVEAIVPEDLSIPSEWANAENDPLAEKAKSMLNVG
jgi:hypothetical protein